MVNKNIVLVSLIVFSVIFLTGVVFAFSWSDLITGKVTKALPPAQWQETDGGLDKDEAGLIYTGNEFIGDQCSGETKIKEKYLDFYLGKKRVRTLTLTCDYGCETEIIKFTEPNSGSVEKDYTSAKCSGPPAGSCDESDKNVAGNGNNISKAGILVSSGNSVVVEEDKKVGNSIKEYYCEDNKLTSEIIGCPGIIKSEAVTFSDYQRTAYYCEVLPLTCSKQGNVVTYTDEKGRTDTKKDTCVNDRGNNVGSGPNLRTYSCSEENSIGHEDVECENGCSQGACQETTCTETDNGQDIKVRGVTTSGSYSGTDLCLSDGKVLEFFCSSATSPGINVVPKACSNGYVCSNGACVETETETETEGTSESPTTTSTCTDTDENRNGKTKRFYLKGTATDALGPNTDVCSDSASGESDYLTEYYCENGVVKHAGKLCGASNSCQDGACIPQEVSETE